MPHVQPRAQIRPRAPTPVVSSGSLTDDPSGSSAPKPDFQWNQTSDGSDLQRVLEHVHWSTVPSWSPDERYLAFTQVDESPVALAQRYQIFENSFQVTEERYPFTGAANVRIKLAVMELATGKTVWVDLGEDEDIYLARIDIL